MSTCQQKIPDMNERMAGQDTMTQCFKIKTSAVNLHVYVYKTRYMHVHNKKFTHFYKHFVTVRSLNTNMRCS